MTEKKSDYNTAIVIGGDYCISAPRSKLISRGLKILESLEKMPLTIVRDMIVDIRENGHLIRRAIIDPVRIKGERIREVYLGYVFNEKNLSPERIEHYDIRIGDTVTIESIVGFISLRVVKGKRTGNEKIFTMPVKCQACGSKIETLEPDSAYYCTGNACPGRIKAQLMAFSDSMHIGLNPELAKELVDKRMVLDSADLYFLKKKDLIRLNKMNEDSAQRILDAIEKSRHPELVDIIIALLETAGIPLHKGIEVAVACNSINDLSDADKLSRIKTIWIKPNYVIGNTLALSIQKLMNESKTLKFLEKLKKGGVVFPRKGVN